MGSDWSGVRIVICEEMTRVEISDSVRIHDDRRRRILRPSFQNLC